MENFWGSEVWGTFNMIAVLLLSLLAANIMRRKIPFLRDSLIPVSVLGGILLVVLSAVYKWITGTQIFMTEFFGGNGYGSMEVLTYHCLALGFIASTFKPSQGEMTKKRAGEVFNTGVTTVATYLLQAVLGFGISLLAAMLIKDFFQAAGVLLPFGYGQGPGQAMNYGNIYEADYGCVGGKSFGLTIAALGFVSASIGGVIHLNWLKRKGKIKLERKEDNKESHQIHTENEIPMQESMDKMTVQIALIAVAYMLSYVLMYLLGLALPGMKSVIYGFNFLLGVLAATIVKGVLKLLQKTKLMKREYTNDFLMTRTSNFFFDLMVVASIGVIRLDLLEDYWGIMLIMGVVGMLSTYLYNLWVAKKLFPAYAQEQFLMMFGMLTGTASTGVILLREIDGDFKTPAADNMVYQNFPAIVFGFPLMLLATLAPQKPWLTFGILVGFFLVMNLILFRNSIFRRKKKETEE